MSVGISFAMMKIGGAANKAGESLFSMFVFTSYTAGGVSSLFAILVLNFALRNYHQIDVMPIFESLGLIFQILAGLWLFNEIAYYSWLESLGIFGSALLIIVGIFILAAKHNYQRANANDDDDFKRSKKIEAGKLNAIWDLVNHPVYHEFEKPKDLCVTPQISNTSMINFLDTTQEYSLQ